MKNDILNLEQKLEYGEFFGLPFIEAYMDLDALNTFCIHELAGAKV